MSMDAGGLAQMTYQSQLNNQIGISGPGFASRGKGSHIKRLSVAPPPKISTIDESQQANAISTPRTSRGHLLAGLRTAPKSATIPQTNGRFDLQNSKYANSNYNQVPQTATGAFFPANNQNFGYDAGRQMYSLPEQILAPPTLEFDDQAEMDQKLYHELVATNAYLAQQQRALQQQLMDVTAAAQQFGGLNLNNSNANLGGYGLQSPITPITNFYGQQCQQGLQPIVQAVPNSPGVFSVYNPMTGQTNYVVDNTAQMQDVASAAPSRVQSPPSLPTPSMQRDFSPPLESSLTTSRSRSPPKTSISPPINVEPLPPPSANAFRRGHKKQLSSVTGASISSDVPKSAGPRSAAFPPTPMTGTFGPGQGRAGEHPIRQPRGPPLLQELEEKPTSKHEGSKNFATRQRRRALHDLFKAGRERRSDTRAGSGSNSPGSEAEFHFSVTSSENDEGVVSGLSSKASSGSLHGAIGSERKEKSRERSSVDSTGARSLGSDDGISGKLVEIDSSRRKAAMLVLSSAEKRKSTIAA